MKNTHWKLLLIIIVLNVLGTASWWYIHAKTTQVRDEIYTTRGGLAEISARVENIKRLEGILADVETERRAIEGSFADSRSVVHFIEKMEELATTTQVKLKVQSAALPATAKDLGPVFHVEAIGNFGAIYKFADLLMASDYQVLLDNFFIGQEEDPVKKVKFWRANFVLRMISYANR